MNSNVVVIPLDRYEELIRTEARVNVVVERIAHNDFFSVEDILWILDTDLSIGLAQNMYEQRQKEREKWKDLKNSVE